MTFVYVYEMVVVANEWQGYMNKICDKIWMHQNQVRYTQNPLFTHRQNFANHQFEEINSFRVLASELPAKYFYRTILNEQCFALVLAGRPFGRLGGGDFFQRLTIWSDLGCSRSLVTPLWLGGGGGGVTNRLINYQGKTVAWKLSGNFEPTQMWQPCM